MKRISPYKTGLDSGNAYWMARLSKEVYVKTSEEDQTPDEKKILESLKADDDQFISIKGADANSAQAALIEHKNYLCMAFRGTNEVKDWLDNINAFSVKVLFGEFHRGFWNSVEDVWAPLDAELRALQARIPRPVFFTGHSLGGAMAVIAAAKYIHEDKPFTGLYTFGQPRTMTRETSRIFNAECGNRYFRFHNNNDIVTRIPARFMGYSHAGTYLYIDSKGGIHQEPGHWFAFIDHLSGVVDAITQDGIDAVEDHYIDRYIVPVAEWQFENAD